MKHLKLIAIKINTDAIKINTDAIWWLNLSTIKMMFTQSNQILEWTSLNWL